MNFGFLTTFLGVSILKKGPGSGYRLQVLIARLLAAKAWLWVLHSHLKSRKQRNSPYHQGRTLCTGGYKKQKSLSLETGFSKERRRHTLPQIAVPSAQAGLTSLFGMGRGEPRRRNHLKTIPLPASPRGRCQPF